jgi:hypothetical protein
MVIGADGVDPCSRPPRRGEERETLVGFLRWRRETRLVHMVEEYARHNGHADLLRERIDGAVGE